MKFRQGDSWARERLVLSRLPSVISIARRYRRHGCSLPDLVQEGTVGLLEAVKRFNPTAGNPFVDIRHVVDSRRNARTTYCDRGLSSGR